jgi:hypothetical protein
MKGVRVPTLPFRAPLHEGRPRITSRRPEPLANARPAAPHCDDAALLVLLLLAYLGVVAVIPHQR